MRKFFYFFAFILAFSAGINAQTERNCAAMDVLEQQIAADPTLPGRMEAIERHTEEFIASGAHQQDRVVITIPVVFHVIHNGDAVGTNENISDTYIMAQLNQLNLDFRKQNADASLIPSIFTGVAADAEIQFCLAQRTPSGAATTGINRVYYNTSAPTTSYMDNTVKPATIWDRTKYLNIWTANLSGGILGYAQFPGGSASTDGVVCLHSSIGSVATPNPAGGAYGKGRTATHEVGHWLNLRHIWGDANCGNDQVSDTPVHNAANYGCPAYPHYSTCTGTPVEMTMNYMDYTDDACMYMFTAGQKARMQAVLAAGGSRAALATSNGCTPPNTSSCGTASGLSAGSITQTGATLSWGAVSGATSYNVQYRATGAATWTSATATATSTAVSGLSCATGYEFQVQAVCSGTNGSFSASATFTTAACTSSCGTPSGLSASGITQTSATLNWAAVSGATGYNVQARQVGTTTWSTGSVTTTSVNFTGLICNTNYEFQVQAVCGSTTGSFSASANFTTSACTSSCTDTYESNNTSATAKTIPKNSPITALIGTSTDVDWFKFTLTSTQKNIRVTLSNLPFDYDMQLYRNSTLLATSQNGGTTNEVIVRNNTSTSGTYYVRVYGYNGAFSATQCYTLLVEAGATAYRLEAGAEELMVAEQTPTAFEVTPNPVNGLATLSIMPGATDEAFTISVYDVTGRLVMNQNGLSTKENTQIPLDFSILSNGMYIVRLETATQSASQKVIVNNR